jgi:hypothetical protein
MQSGVKIWAGEVICVPLIVSNSFAGQYQLHVGAPISQVRAELLKQGWTPIRIDSKLYNGSVENQESDALLLFQAGFFEVESCSGTDANVCFFNYQKNGQCLRLTTEGEYLPPRGEPGLVSWSQDCPD